MELKINMRPQRTFDYINRRDVVVLPAHGFYYSKLRAKQKHSRVVVTARGQTPYQSRIVAVAHVDFYPEEMDSVYRTQVMENVVMLCEVKWQELYGV